VAGEPVGKPIDPVGVLAHDLVPRGRNPRRLSHSTHLPSAPFVSIVHGQTNKPTCMSAKRQRWIPRSRARRNRELPAVGCTAVHTYPADVDRMARELADYCLNRLAESVPLDHALTPEELLDAAGETITPSGIGAKAALGLWRDVLGPACLSNDH